ncbi:maternal B9.15 protein-like [Ascaphus truei]|uniref:maternal B9.15 protein-like n=1 Tax=Ascaphus truei TaxID=8439 RepID=UPI003F5A4F03
MRQEVELGASYIVRLLNRHQKLDSAQEGRFIQTLSAILCDMFTGHWYPDRPQKGQAYRCIRIEQSLSVDACVLQACVRSGLRCSQLALPRYMYLWIDPKEVSCRLSETCSPFLVMPPEDTKTQNPRTPEKPDLETSDYHSDGSDTAGTPCESSSEDEEPGGSKNMQPTPVIIPKKVGPQFYYNPAPASTFFYPYPRNAMSFIPTYQPMTLYYLVQEPPKVYQSSKSRGTHKRWKANKTTPQATC